MTECYFYCATASTRSNSSANGARLAPADLSYPLRASDCVERQNWQNSASFWHFLARWSVTQNLLHVGCVLHINDDMQISRCLLVLCAAFCALSVRGDNEAQKKAREALQNFMQSAPAQPAPASPVTPAAPAKPTPPRAPSAAKAAAPAPVAPVQAADSESIAKAREAMRQKMQGIAGQPSVPATPVQPAPQAAPVAAQPAAAVVAQPTTATPVAPAESDPAAIAKAREAVRQKMQEIVGQQPAPAVVQPAAVPAQPTTPAQPAVVAAPTAAPAVEAIPAPTPEQEAAIAKAREAMRAKMQEVVQSGGAETASGQFGPAPVFPPGADEKAMAKARDSMRLKMQDVIAQPQPQIVRATTPEPRVRRTSLTAYNSRLNFPPLEAPPLPISAEKQQRLAGLLQKYQADQVSPEEYHAERAKILSGE